jgi:enoyl-CoA hydratase/carnithine racemase
MSEGDDLPEEIQVEIDGPVRIVRFNRPDDLNATNHVLRGGAARAVAGARGCRRRARA